VTLSSEVIACENSSKGLHPEVASASTSDDISNEVANKAQLVITQSHDPPMQIASAVGGIASGVGALKVGEQETLCQKC
jgi:hypothetical protein